MCFYGICTRRSTEKRAMISLRLYFVKRAVEPKRMEMTRKRRTRKWNDTTSQGVTSNDESHRLQYFIQIDLRYTSIYSSSDHRNTQQTPLLSLHFAPSRACTCFQSPGTQVLDMNLKSYVDLCIFINPQAVKALWYLFLKKIIPRWGTFVSQTTPWPLGC